MQHLIDAVEQAERQAKQAETKLDAAIMAVANIDEENGKNKAAVAAAVAALAAAYAGAGAAAQDGQDGDEWEAKIGAAKADKMVAVTRSNESNVAFAFAAEALKNARAAMVDADQNVRLAQEALDAAKEAAAAEQEADAIDVEEQEDGAERVFDETDLFAVPLSEFQDIEPAKKSKFYCCRICQEVAHPEIKCKFLQDGEETLNMLHGLTEKEMDTFAEKAIAAGESRKRFIDALRNVEAIKGKLDDETYEKMAETPFAIEQATQCPFCLVDFGKHAGLFAHRASLANCPISYVFSFIMAKRMEKPVDKFYAIRKMDAAVAVEEIVNDDKEDDNRLTKFMDSVEAMVLRLQSKIDVLEAEAKTKNNRILALEQKLECMENVESPSQGTPVKKMRLMRSVSVYDMEDANRGIDPSLLANL